MKNIFKSFLVVVCSGIFLNSCETTDLDLRVSPNDLTTSQADPNLILNAIQLAGVSNMDRFNDLSAQLTRIQYMTGRIYFNNFQGGVMNSVWSRTYSSEFNLAGDTGVDVGLFTNVEALKEINANSDINYDFHVAVGQTIKAYSLMLLTDFIGQAAFTQAGNPDEFPAPILDDGPVVYDGALALLDEAEALFQTNPSTLGATDFFYGGDSTKWIKLINSLRLRTYFLTGNTAAFNAVVAGGDYIETIEDDFQFQYGARVLQPDTRHPEYADDYGPTGAGGYLSNWLMETMLDKDDPRIRYYFYRQVEATPGADADPDEQFLSCSLFTVPQHFVDGGFTFCSVPNGYWGRTHGNDEGTPPDGFFKTAYGVYPAGGRFDDNSFASIGLGQGGGGAGIRPIILSAYVDFWRGAMASTPAQKAALLRSAMEKSIEKVQSFGALDGNADKSFEPSEADVTGYINETITAFNAATGDAQEDVFAEQYWIAQWGGAQEAWNYYRKTGYPTTLSPSWEPDPGPFPRSFFYPQDEVITNPNLDQRLDLTNQVFWDNNPASPAFPAAN